MRLSVCALLVACHDLYRGRLVAKFGAAGRRVFCSLQVMICAEADLWAISAALPSHTKDCSCLAIKLRKGVLHVAGHDLRRGRRLLVPVQAA